MEQLLDLQKKVKKKSLFETLCDTEYVLRNNYKICSSILKLHSAFQAKLETEVISYPVKGDKKGELKDVALKKKIEKQIAAIDKKITTTKRDVTRRKKLELELAALEIGKPIKKIVSKRPVTRRHHRKRFTTRKRVAPRKKEKKTKNKICSESFECRINYEPDYESDTPEFAKNFWTCVSNSFKCIETSPKRKKHRKKDKERNNGRKSSKHKNAEKNRIVEKNGANNTNLCDILGTRFMKSFRAEDLDADRLLQDPPNFVARNRLGFFESLKMPPLIF